MQIGDVTIDPSAPAFVVAEIGLNHNGSLDLAMELVESAAAAGANCAKFQMRNMAALYRNTVFPNDIREDVPAQYVLDILSRCQLSTQDMFSAFDPLQEERNLASLHSVGSRQRHGAGKVWNGGLQDLVGRPYEP